MHIHRNLWIGGVLLAGALAMWFGQAFAAGDPVLPGSDQDPLVTRSFVTSYVNSTVDSKLAMAVVELAAGQKLIGSIGAEIIVRSGSATVVDTLQGGLSDVTAGKDLKMGEAAPPNHLLIVPRGDGRGISATTSLFVMVRGGYAIE